MSCLLVFLAADDRGKEILREVAERFEVPGHFRSDHEAEFWLSGPDAKGVDALDPVLDKVDASWRDHLGCLTQP